MLYTYGVVVSMFDFHCSDRGSMERRPLQVSENHKPRVHPSHVREIG